MIHQEWFEFSIFDIFEFNRGQRLIEEEIVSGDIPYISSTKNNNGVNNFVLPPEFMKLHNNKMTLSNSGSVGYLFYHPYAFVASDHVTVIGIKDKKVVLGYEIALFLKPIFEQMNYKYNFGREISDKRLGKEKILLPAFDRDNLKFPDWQYMKEYIRAIEKNIVFKKLESPKKLQMNYLNNINTKEFALDGELFIIERGERLTKENRVQGSTPLVTAGYLDQGIACFIETEDLKTYQNVITIDMFGNAFYRDYEFVCDDNILVLIPQIELNVYRAMYVLTLIDLDKFKYSYGRQYRQKHIKKHKIFLPYNYSTHKIDFDLIDNTIKLVDYIGKI